MKTLPRFRPLFLCVLLIVTYCFSPLRARPPAPRADSLRLVLQGLSGIERGPVLCSLIHTIQYQDHQEAHRLSQELETLARVHQNDTLLLQAWLSRAALFHQRSQFDSTKILSLRGLRKATELKHKYLIRNFHNTLGGVYEKRNLLDSALIHYHQALAASEKLDVKIYNNLALIYRHQLNYTKSLEYYELALAEAQRTEDLNLQAVLSNNIAPIYAKLGDLTTATEYAQRSIELKERVGDERGKIFAYINLIDMEPSLAQRKDYVTEGLRIARVAQDSLFLKLFSVFMADIYREEGQLGLALQLAKATYREILKKPGREIFDALATLIDIHLAREEYDRALHYALAFKERTGSQGATGQQLRANRYLLAIYSRQDNYAQYHAIAREYYPIRDSLQSAAVLNQLAVLNQQIADSEREKEIVLLNASLDQAATKRFWLSVLGVLIVLILSLILYFRNRQLKTQRATILREQESTKTLADLNERLKRMDVLKNRWYTNISHEFRTPLTIIAGMTDQMIKAPEVWLEKGAQLVQQNTNKLLNLVNQMLDLRKLESDELKVHLVRGDVVSFLRYLSDSFRPYAQSQGLDLHFWSTEERIPMDHDPDKLLHIFSNLLSNAIKYTPTGGDIYLQLDRRKDQGQEQLEISVRDTGPGIAASEIPLVFDRFYQVDDAASRSGTGTGIGLHLTRGLVQLLGGQIGLRSEVGKGSTFRVHLPITLRAEVYGRSIGVSPPTIPFGPIAPGYPPSPSPAPSSDRPHLLIVEDQADVVTYLTSILEADYQLSIAEDGERGIEMALADVPDLIVSDVMMPRKDGYELCTTLKEDLRTSHIPIVLLTAKADSESRISGLQRGADAYLSKPFAPQELLVRLQQLLHLRRTLQERYAAIGSVERKAEAVASREEVFLQRMRALVEAHLSDPDLNMPRVCKALEMSRSQVYKKIKALTGRTPSQYIRSIRLHHARRLLQSSDLNVSEVAYEVGFSSPFYFSNVFLAEFGVRPNETRK